ncbi:hypothetical protein BC629DRAFT_1601846 [Irpex lacteus]|nr:hypothetical protein BC629DRAFT_1601846 [Irpex lacteus]
MTSTTSQSPSLQHLISSRTKFIEAVEEAINPPKNFDWVTTWLCVRSYQELDPAFSDLLVVRHAFKFLRLVHTTATLPSWWRSDFANLMTPFVNAQRDLVRNKGPNHTKVAHKLRKIGLLDETTDVGTAAGEAGSSKAARLSRAQEQPQQQPAPSSPTSVVFKRPRISPQPDSSARNEQKGKRKAHDADIEEDELVNDDDEDEEIVILGHRKPKREKVYRPVSAYHYYRGSERCGNCVKSNTFPCKVPISTTKCFMSCERCRRRKTKCDRPWAFSSSPAKEKGKERASTSGQRQMNKTVQQAVLTVCDRLDAAIAQRISQVQAQVHVTAEWVNAQAQEPQGSGPTQPAAQTDPIANKMSDDQSTTQASRNTRPTVLDAPRPRALFPPTTSIPATTSGNDANAPTKHASKPSTIASEGPLQPSTAPFTDRSSRNKSAPSSRQNKSQPSRSAQVFSSATSTSTAAAASKDSNSNSTGNTNATVVVPAASKRSSQITVPSNSTVPAPAHPAPDPPQTSASAPKTTTVANTTPTNNTNVQSDSTSMKDSDPIKHYFHLATRYAELQTRHAEITAELVKTYEEMIGVVDGERERAFESQEEQSVQWKLPEAFKPDRLVDFSTGSGGVTGGAGKGKEKDEGARGVMGRVGR